MLETSVLDASIIDVSVIETSRTESMKAGKTFKQHLMEELCCSFCLLVLAEPMMTACDHLFCKKCLHNYMRKCQHCPTCKQVINASTNRPVPTPINNILNKLNKMSDRVFPYNQLLELSCAVESVDLELDEIETNPAPANQNLLTNLHHQVLASIAQGRSPQASDRARSGSNRLNQQTRLQLENQIQTVLGRLNTGVTTRSVANSTAGGGSVRTPITVGLTGNLLIANLISATTRSPETGNQTANSSRAPNSGSTIGTRLLGSASICSATGGPVLNQPFRSPVTKRTTASVNPTPARQVNPTIQQFSRLDVPLNQNRAGTGSTRTGQQEKVNVSNKTQQIKKSLKNEFEEECLCSICLAIMSDPCLLPCNHVYCENCILTWLKADDKTCPICKKYTLSSTVKSGPRVLRVLRKIILKLHALPDVDLEAPRKRKIEVICLDQEPAKRPVPKPKNFAGTIPLVMLD